jgi:hypothetical protein
MRVCVLLLGLMVFSACRLPPHASATTQLQCAAAEISRSTAWVDSLSRAYVNPQTIISTPLGTLIAGVPSYVFHGSPVAERVSRDSIIAFVYTRYGRINLIPTPRHGMIVKSLRAAAVGKTVGRLRSLHLQKNEQTPVHRKTAL